MAPGRATANGRKDAMAMCQLMTTMRNAFREDGLSVDGTSPFTFRAGTRLVGDREWSGDDMST